MKHRTIAWALGAVSLTMTPALGETEHPISTHWMHVEFIGKTLRIDWEVLADDLLWFHGLAPDGRDRVSTDALRQAAQEYPSYLVDALEVTFESGPILVGTLIESSFPDWSVHGVELVELQRQSLRLRVEYALPPSHGWCTVFYRGSDGPSSVPIWIELVVQSAVGTPISTHTMTANQPIVILSPDLGGALASSPPRPDPNRTRSCLFVASDGSVKHVVDLPLRSLAEAIGIDSRDPRPLTITEEEHALSAVRDLLLAKTSVRLDGREVTALRVSGAVQGPWMTHEAGSPRAARTSTPSSSWGRRCANLHFEVSYPGVVANETLVELEWRLWNTTIDAIDSRLGLAEEAGSTRTLRPSGLVHLDSITAAPERPAPDVAVRGTLF